MDELIARLRKEYMQRGLDENEALSNPFEQFKLWFDEAVAAPLPEPNAMVLATATADGRPSARAVLLKGFDERGLTFYTNYRSRKGNELETNPRAAILFLWDELERQVRIEGRVERVSAEQSDAYFASRPRGSRIGAWASQQSRVIAGREELERRVAQLEQEFAGVDVPRPPFWGGYRLVPEQFEFWQGRQSRLHDRLRYRLDDGRWVIERLSP